MSRFQELPDYLLKQKDTRPLLDWLHQEGLSMTLLELGIERKRRGITPPIRNLAAGGRP